MQFEKIYINNNPIVITTHKSQYIAQYAQKNNVQVFTLDTIRLAKKFLEQYEQAVAIIEESSMINVLKALNSIFMPIVAAGGLVVNEHNAVLMIERLGVWDLPKGKTESGEAIEESALREVREETGLEQLKLNEFICNTYHMYTHANQEILKTTFWYKMNGLSNEPLRPQTEEAITAARWINKAQIPQHLNNSYETIRDVFKTAGYQI